MTKLVLTLALSTCFIAPALAGDPDLEAARDALQTARARLKAAKGDFDGHRARAGDFVESALQQVNAGLRVDTHQERHEDKREQQIDKKIDKLEKQKEKLEHD